MEELKHIPDRRSIRRYTDQKIDNEDIKTILTALGYQEEQKQRPERFHGKKVKHNGWDLPFFQE